MLRKIWADPVWSKVIAAVVIAILAAIATYSAGLWSGIFAVLVDIVIFSAAVTSVSNWLLAILILCGVAVVGLLIIVICAFTFGSKNSPSAQTYVVDEILGIRWRWKYGQGGEIYDLFSFCSLCDFQVYPRDVSAFRAVDHIEYRCDDCGNILNDFDMPVEAIESQVIRHIQKKIRSGSWNLANTT